MVRKFEAEVGRARRLEGAAAGIIEVAGMDIPNTGLSVV